jgi:hypothetical protein
VDVGYIFVVHEGLKHPPSNEIFLQMNDDIDPLDIVEGFAPFANNTVYGLGDNRLRRGCTRHLLLQREITAELSTSFAHNR